ncbi:MAG: electron transfer flavoprotein subunit alpha/FixB family protein [Tissierellia bacterium]|nr:electron transfer flavoprotein subunit alpha/FixB family protein [Tissierellia bacterium]
MAEKNIWVVAELTEGKPINLSVELLGKATKLAEEKGGDVVGVVIGKDTQEACDIMIKYGAKKVLKVDGDVYEQYSTDAYTKALETLLDKYDPLLVLFGATENGRDLAARLAARKELGLVADCLNIISVDEETEFKWERPTFDGKLYSDIRIKTKPQLATIASKIFRGNKPNDGAEGEIIEESVEFSIDEIRTKILEVMKNEHDTTTDDLETADIVVSGGRGLDNADNWYLIDNLAKALGGTTGASRPICDAGWVDVKKQVGATGVKITPKIYIAVGISGAIQHLAGMKKSSLIIAINNDPEAPIFKAAHYGIVGDLFKVVPALTEAIEELNKK